MKLSKYGKPLTLSPNQSGNVNVENELAEMNRLKRIELQLKIVEVTGTIDKEFVQKFLALIKLDGVQ